MQFTSPDTLIPDLYNPLNLNRHSYVRYNPIRYSDPSGHRPDDGCRSEGGCNLSDLQKGFDAQDAASNAYDPTGQKQKRNREIAEAIIYGGTETVASLLAEPMDWALIAYHCANGECSPWMLAGLLPLIPGSAGRHLDDVPWKSIVSSEYWELIEGAFRGSPQVLELTDDLTVFRRYGGTSVPTGSPWFSLKPYANSTNAKRYLALPNDNLATNVAEFVIPKGTRILLGKVANQTSDLVTFGMHAIGGGFQIYIPNPVVAIFKGIVK